MDIVLNEYPFVRMYVKYEVVCQECWVKFDPPLLYRCWSWKARFSYSIFPVCAYVDLYLKAHVCLVKLNIHFF